MTSKDLRKVAREIRTAHVRPVEPKQTERRVVGRQVDAATMDDLNSMLKGLSEYKSVIDSVKKKVKDQSVNDLEKAYKDLLNSAKEVISAL